LNTYSKTSHFLQLLV